MKKAISAGGIIIHNNKILLLTYPESDLTRFPKGHVEPGETLEQAALREVKEETGLQNLEIVKKLGFLTRKSTEDWGEEVVKDIHMYLMKSHNFNHQKSDSTYDWFPIDFAIGHMYFPEEKEFLITILPSIVNGNL
ncbi:MAG: putative NTP pyrophosphohydrolase [Microgenomates group bacterium Gr01-1014_16]|nr:MAG: putative NTP pyrophosphohydrolase [Microgenomates group bacterium Gr01-1014_16]